ncbi:hypothetical protein Tco_0570417 [Tanacetum coccineum]
MVADNSMDLNLPNLNKSFTESQVNDNVGFDFDNTENHSLEGMVRTGKEEIHEDELASENGEEGVNKSDFVEGENFDNDKIEEVNFIDVHVDQTPTKQKSEGSNCIITLPHPFAQLHAIPMTIFTPMFFLYSFTVDRNNA